MIDTTFDGAGRLGLTQRMSRSVTSWPLVQTLARPVKGPVAWACTSPNGTRWVYEGETGKIEDRSSVYKDALRNRWVYSIKALALPHPWTHSPLGNHPDQMCSGVVTGFDLCKAQYRRVTHHNGWTLIISIKPIWHATVLSCAPHPALYVAPLP